MFFQVQHVERGGVVPVDPIVKGGKVISTAVINGANDIRVRLYLRVEPGDVYGLPGFRGRCGPITTRGVDDH